MCAAMRHPDGAAELRPTVEAACVVCGGRAFETLCTARDIEAQRTYLRAFHRRRLRAGVPSSALADRAEFSQDYSTDVVGCAECGLIMRNPRPTVEAIRRAYRQDDYGKERLASLFEAQVALYRPKARRLARRLPPGARVVEVGSFVGGFLTAGRELGWEMLGVDPGEEVDAFCSAHRLNVLRATLAEAPLPNASTDCVAIWNTFDQIPDPMPTLVAARRILRTGGLLVLRVPNGQSFRAGMARYRTSRRGPLRPAAQWLLHAMAWNNLLAFPYLYGYSAASLARLVRRSGFEAIAVEGDTLCRLADAQNATWSRWEEAILKACWRAAIALERAASPEQFAVAPWLDLTCRAAA